MATPSCVVVLGSISSISIIILQLKAHELTELTVMNDAAAQTFAEKIFSH